MLSIKVIVPRHNIKGLASEMFIWKCPNCGREIRQMSYEIMPQECTKCKRILPNIKAIVSQDYFRARWHRQRGTNKSPIYSIYKRSGD